MAQPALEVHLANRFAGTLLRKENGNLQFRYDPAYVEAKGAPLSLNLPVRADAYPHRDCLAFFGNLLPEEDVRRQVALATGISAANDYKLLERFGGDVAGAVTLLPKGAGPTSPRPTASSSSPPSDSTRSSRNCPSARLRPTRRARCGCHWPGRRASCPWSRSTAPSPCRTGRSAPPLNILKPEPERFPGLVTNEFFCMRLAREVGLQVAGVRRAETTSGIPFLIVARYDRDLTQGRFDASTRRTSARRWASSTSRSTSTKEGPASATLCS